MTWHSIGALGVMAGMTFVGHDDPSAPGSQESLVGSWIWVESTGGFAGMTRTPASTGETLTLAFTSDGLIEVVQNGVFQRSIPFTATPGTDAGTFLVSYAEPLFGFATQTATLVGTDALTLADPCCDGFTYRFVSNR